MDPYELSDCARQWTPLQHDRIAADIAAKGDVMVLVTPPPSNER